MDDPRKKLLNNSTNHLNVWTSTTSIWSSTMRSSGLTIHTVSFTPREQTPHCLKPAKQVSFVTSDSPATKIRIHLYMLEIAKENGFRFDTVQMPLNVMDAHYRSFEKRVLP